MRWYYEMAFEKRNEFELYDISQDPFQLKNLAGKDEYNKIQSALTNELKEYLTERGDLRMLGQEDVYFQAPYYNNKRPIPGR